MQSKIITAAALGLAGVLTTSLALAAAPDWSKVAGTETAVFYPGVSPIEWIMKGTVHGGARGLKMGETCSECHSEEIADMGQTIVSGEKIEPTPIKGKAGSIPVTVRAAHDGSNLYLQFTWKQPAGGAAKMDPDNQVKLSVLLAGDKVDRANLSGCWEACHGDLRTMPDVKGDEKTKYVANASLAGGVYYDLMQWTSKGAKHDGHIADKRVMDGGTALIEAKGIRTGDNWTVTFVRKLAGTAAGDIKLMSGKVYSFGFAIHDDYTKGRFHQVSLDQHLGIDADAGVVAKKQ